MSDIIVAKLNTNGSKIKAATFLGGSGGDISLGMSVDQSGKVWLSGSTSSLDLPVTVDAMQGEYQGGEHDSFVAVLDPGLTSLLHLTYLGGSNDDGSGHVAIAPNGDAIVACITISDDFPTTDGVHQTEHTEGIAAATVTRFDIPLAR